MVTSSALEAICRTEAFPRDLVAGRSVSLSEIKSSLGRTRMQSVWIYGMRRVGKTVLAQAALHDVAQERGARVIRVNASCAAGPNLPDLCKEMAQACTRAAIQVSDESRDAVLRSIATASKRSPVVIFLEDFDHTAGQLDVNDQAALRVLAQEHPNIAFVIETRRAPSFLLEDVEENSRLAGICTHIPVSPFTKGDTDDFCRRVAEHSGIHRLAGVGSKLWSLFGGFPYLVAQGVSRVAVHLQAGEDSLEEAIENTVLRLEEDIRQTWLQLPQDIRAALRDPQQVPPSRVRLKATGLHDPTVPAGMVRPAALVDAGNELGDTRGSGRSDVSLLEKAALIQELVAVANSAIKARSGQDGFRATHDAAFAWRFMRTPCSEEVFGGCVQYLYSVLWERTRKGDGGNAASLLPEFLQDILRGGEAPKWVSVLRNGRAHDKSKPSDDERKNPSWEERCGIQYALAGSRSLDTDKARAAAREKLIDGVIEFLEHFVECARAGAVDSEGRYASACSKRPLRTPPPEPASS